MKKKTHTKKKNLSGNELPQLNYPAKEDIYKKAKKKELADKDPYKLSRGLDVPGGELDDANEKIGEEDEENNYYSLGGDAHNNLDETPP